MKHCKVCWELLPRSEYYGDRSRPDGLRGSCKACDGKYYQKRRNPTKLEMDTVEFADLLKNWRVT